MIDKKLLALLGANKKYIYYTVALMILGLFANLSITAAICRTIELAVNFQQYETFCFRRRLLRRARRCGMPHPAARGNCAIRSAAGQRRNCASVCTARSSVSASARRTA